MLVAALSFLIAQAPTPLGVAVTAPPKERALAARLEHRAVALLKSDNRFVPVVLPTGAAFDEAAALGKLQEGREAFLFLEPERARVLLEEATEELFLAYDLLEEREIVLDGMAQRAAILLQLGDRRGAVAQLELLLNLAPQYDAEGVEDVGDAALELQRSVRAKRKHAKKGRILVAAPAKGPFPEVWIDGHRVGVTPVEVQVPVGPHVVALRGPGVQRIARRVVVKPRKVARVAVPSVDRTPEGQRFYDLVDRVSLARAGYQEAMGQAAAVLGGPPEILFLTLSPRDRGMLARARRVRPGDRLILGSAEAPVEKSGEDLDDALLFLLEEVLLGERTPGPEISAAGGGPRLSSGSAVLSAPGRGPAAPSSPDAEPRTESSEAAGDPSAGGSPPVEGESSPPGPGASTSSPAGAPVIPGRAPGDVSASPTATAEAEEASPIVWGGVGVASGAGAAILVGVVAGTGATLAVFGPTWLNAALSPPPSAAGDAHGRAARFVVLGY